ncbi:N-alpha-acetyltransferase 15, NatA auxiliary subunit [Sitophilus oryzae]|uniref:N-alpha-acetyltransferase 15, NatA auxiliary subunit n=1 Tax=Sitophilus oryzae TaxID=7048 RepID=A0A6J2X3J0_SITOR|nr:N-alpha-acetyltransferase 15, NatA auxiliary subunit [Sitophilus oryzae]
MPSSNPLPPKENALFKRILKSYEHKQYKNGLKFAKQILTNPKFQEHGETLAMKGLTLNCLGRKDEAYEYVRRGLRNDLRSHVCWHVYGLLQRSDKKYDEAIKCYRNALKWEKDNIQILRDLSLLQIQMRDLEGYRDTRYQLLMLRPTQRASWIGYAMSFHLLEDYKNALNILDTFLDQQQKLSTTVDYEQSELLLYQNLIVQESGDLLQALNHLEVYSPQIVDKLTLKENLAELNLKLEVYNEATQIYEELVQRNPENTLYYKKLIESKRLTKEEDILAFYLKYSEKFPRAMPPKRLPLNYATGVQFKQLVDKYMRKAFSKGVPPLFVDLRSLYKDAEKVRIIEELVLSYVEALKKSNKYSETESTNGPKEPASAILWVYFFLAQHYDYLKQTDKALTYIETAIDHTPTLIELFVAKGRIFKHAGDPAEAYRCLDEAQAMDTADRYINSKCAKYMLRANLIKEAEDICSKFTREGVSAMENLNEMQCMWFQTECALAYQRLEKYGEALKKCHEIDRHFSEIIEDQFDFHTYCMRKMTLRSYVGLLRLEDVLRGHPFYFKAAKCAIEVYLHLFDAPLKDESAEQELNTENLAPSELKKLRNKQRKAKKKAEQESAQAREAQVKRDQHHKSRQQGDVEADAPQLDELIPDKLARVDDPLDQAIKFLQPLQTLARDRIETHLMAFEVYYRKRKVLLMLQSIKRAHKVDPKHPKLHSCLIRFLQVVKENQSTFDPAVSEVITIETKSLLSTKDAKTLNKEFLDNHKNSLKAALEGAIVMYQLEEKSQKEALSLVTDIDNNKFNDVDIEICTDILKSLRNGEIGSCTPSQLDSFVQRCHARYPYAAAFKPPQEAQEPTTDPTQTNHVSDQDCCGN